MSDAYGIPAFGTMVHNVIDTFRRATDDQHMRGAAWYPDAHVFAATLDPGNVNRAAGVMAALSPRMPWERNLLLAARAYAEGGASGCLGANVRAANRILAGERWADVLKGPKTRAFAATIADPVGAEWVVIDRHALSIALGRQSSDADQKWLALKGRYQTMESAYVAAAERLGYPHATVQAVTWLVWRERDKHGA